MPSGILCQFRPLGHPQFARRENETNTGSGITSFSFGIQNDTRRNGVPRHSKIRAVTLPTIGKRDVSENVPGQNLAGAAFGQDGCRRLSAQPVVQLRRLSFQPKCKAGHGARIKGGDGPSLSSLG